MQEFGLVAQAYQHTHLILGEKEKIEQFWNYYADEGQELRLACRELLFEVRRAMRTDEEIAGLRLATLRDLEQIAPVQAAMAECESGINPLEVDPEGFRARCARRIEMDRVWVLEKDGRLIFKSDVQADTPDVNLPRRRLGQPGGTRQRNGPEMHEETLPGLPVPHQVSLCSRERTARARSHLLSHVQLQNARHLRLNLPAPGRSFHAGKLAE